MLHMGLSDGKRNNKLCFDSKQKQKDALAAIASATASCCCNWLLLQLPRRLYNVLVLLLERGMLALFAADGDALLARRIYASCFV